MRIGYDAKRAFLNRTGLGNYSRWLVRSMVSSYPHNSYYLWGPRGHDGSTVIVVGGDPARYTRDYQTIERVGELTSPYARRDETDIPIYVLRDRHIPFAAAWPGLKHYN